ncbi:unnamed protein product [Enterobius vermicularis]|uniref:NADH dehydrogenase [ubiquinone] 1 alpha subcomplex subunit 13 n=1 Tax=Enterobius vermicularis TaxID=51028 RepID=A0A0N4UUZ5_ENTVE|nr:unnamed protein product [Enterobius vermicularis]
MSNAGGASGFRQEMPPPGGYNSFNWSRTFPKATEKFEDTDIQNAMTPFLKAERDRRWLKFLKKNRDIENEVMKDVPGWKTGTWYGEPVYFTLGDKWWDPCHFEAYVHSTRRRKMNDLMWRHRSDYDAPLFWDKWVPDIGAKYRDSFGRENFEINPFNWRSYW